METSKFADELDQQEIQVIANRDTNPEAYREYLRAKSRRGIGRGECSNDNRILYENLTGYEIDWLVEHPESSDSK